MRKITKVLIIVLLCIGFININNVYGSQSTTNEDETKMDWKDGFKYADDFINEGANGEVEINGKTKGKSVIDETKLRKNISEIFTFLVSVGTVLIVIIGVILGISFLWASAEEKAKIKEKMIPYILGSVVIYGAFIIWYIVVQVLGKIG